MQSHVEYESYSDAWILSRQTLSYFSILLEILINQMRQLKFSFDRSNVVVEI